MLFLTGELKGKQAMAVEGEGGDIGKCKHTSCRFLVIEDNQFTTDDMFKAIVMMVGKTRIAEQKKAQEDVIRILDRDSESKNGKGGRQLFIQWS